MTRSGHLRRQRRALPLLLVALFLAACEPPLFTGLGPTPGTASPSTAVEVAPPDPTELRRDCGMSAPLSDGALLWVFCGTAVPPSTTVTRENTAAIAAPGDLVEPLDVLDGSGQPYQFITATSAWDQRCNPSTSDARRVTPRSVDTVTSGATDRVLVYFEHVCLASGAVVGSGGIGLAEFAYDPTNPPTGQIQATVLADHLWDGVAPTTPPGTGAPATLVMGGFGRVSAYDPAANLVYVYRCDTDSEPVVGCQVGRVAPANVANRASYRWFNGTNWVTAVPNPGAAVMVMATALGGSPLGAGEVYDIGWYPDAQMWFMTYLEWGATPPYGAAVSTRVASQPHGGWSAPVTVTIPGCTPATPSCRAMFGHPALSDSTTLAASYYSDPAAGGDGRIYTVDAKMFADSWIDVPRSDPDFADLDLVGIYGQVNRIHPNYEFRPDDSATRAELAEMLWRTAGRPAVTLGSPTFTDVGSSHPNRLAVEWLAAAAIDDTAPGGPWSPNSPANRQTAARWMWREAGAPAVTAGATFSDVPTGHPAFTPIMWAWTQGLLAETTPTTWNPTGSILRRDSGVAVILIQDRSVRGAVTDAVTSAPIPGVAVTVYDAADAPVRTVTTDSAGVYQVSWLPVGTGYSIGFNHPAYGDEWHENKPKTTNTLAQAATFAIAADVNRLPGTIGASLTPSSVTVAQPVDGSAAFATETLIAQPDTVDNVARVDFYIDDVLLGTDTSATGGWTLAWDTTTTADGAHSVRAVAVDGDDNETASLEHSVTVDNSLGAPARVQADFDSGKIDVNVFVPQFIEAILRPTVSLPDRYQGPEHAQPVEATTAIHQALAQNWNSMTAAAQADVQAIYTPGLQSGTPDPAFVAAFELWPDPGDENVYPGCDNNLIEWGYLTVVGVWCVQTIEYSTAVCNGASFTCDGDGTEVPDLRFRFSVNGDRHSFGDAPTTEIPGTVVPEEMLAMANQFFNAFEAYEDLGFQIGGNLDDGMPLDITMEDTRAYTIPICWSCHGFDEIADFGVVISPDELGSTPRHEAFHIVQYNYVSEYDVFGEFLPGDLGRDSTLWWMEATANWADHQAVEAMEADGQTPPEPTDYADAFLDFANQPTRTLTRFLPLTEGTRPQYGAYILAEYLQDRFDEANNTNFVRRTFEELDVQDHPLGINERTAIQVIEDVLEENNSSFADALPRFWTAAYLLDDNGSNHFGFEDPALTDWRGALGSEWTSGDEFSSRDRLGRASVNGESLSPAVVPHDGTTGPLTFGNRPGGAGIIDVSLEQGWEGFLTADIDIDPAGRYDKYAAVLVAYDDSGYPNLCDRGSGPEIEIQDLSLAAGTSIELDEACPTASLLIVNHDADSSVGEPDQVTVEFGVTLPNPMDPPTSHSAVIDGPGVTGVLPGTVVGIVSDPPAAGPTTGLLCVDVIVHSGAGIPFFGWVNPIIRIVDPFDMSVVAQKDGFDTLMDAHSTRTVSFGPIERDPWVALGVQLIEEEGDVVTWEATAVSC